MAYIATLTLPPLLHTSVLSDTRCHHRHARVSRLSELTCVACPRMSNAAAAVVAGPQPIDTAVVDCDVVVDGDCDARLTLLLAAQHSSLRCLSLSQQRLTHIQSIASNSRLSRMSAALSQHSDTVRRTRQQLADISASLQSEQRHSPLPPSVTHMVYHATSHSPPLVCSHRPVVCCGVLQSDTAHAASA